MYNRLYCFDRAVWLVPEIIVCYHYIDSFFNNSYEVELFVLPILFISAPQPSQPPPPHPGEEYLAQVLQA
jgi:hypothetical protein